MVTQRFNSSHDALIRRGTAIKSRSGSGSVCWPCPMPVPSCLVVARMRRRGLALSQRHAFFWLYIAPSAVAGGIWGAAPLSPSGSGTHHRGSCRWTDLDGANAADQRSLPPGGGPDHFAQHLGRRRELRADRLRLCPDRSRNIPCFKLTHYPHPSLQNDLNEG